MSNFPLDFLPGIVKVDAPYTLRGRYIDCDKVRFFKGKPEKWKGWETYVSGFLGVPRAMKSWDDFSDARWLAVGTHSKLYVVSSIEVKTNITPFVDTGTLGNDPFTTTNASKIVTVQDTAHGRTVGSTVIFSGATAVGGITINGEYLVNTVVDSSHYTIMHSAAATSGATGGGASVAYQYELSPGEVNVVFGFGYGTSTYGTGTYGTPRANSNFIIYARIWSLDTYGENLLAMPSGNKLYQWDPDTPTDRAALVTNSPTGNFMFITNERYPVVLCADNDNMALAWPDQNDITNWTNSSTSTANVRRLSKGSRLVAGANLVGTANILWTDSAVYSMNYTGQRNFVYDTLHQASNCGLIGPHAFVVVAGRAFWMGQKNFFVYGGTVQFIPRQDEIQDWLFNQLDTSQNWKCNATYSESNNEIRWEYVAEGDQEPSLYVAVSLDDYSWTMGTLNRTAWTEQSGLNSVVYGADENGTVFEHEVGFDADGVAMDWFLESAPIEIDDGNRAMDIWGYIPNFQRQVGDIEVTIKTYDMPNKTTIQEQESDTLFEQIGIVDMHLSGRQASIRLEGFQLGGDFRLGLGAVEVTAAGMRRGSA